MPSPLAHSAMGFIIHRASDPNQPHPACGFRHFIRSTLRSPNFWLVATLSMLPDSDAVLGVLTGEMARFHNNGSHSLFVGLIVALLVAGAIWLFKRSGFTYWFFVSFLAYGMHVIMDAFTVGPRGVMLFWPITDERFASPIRLFYGVRWSDGFISTAHLWTALTEALFVLILFFLWRRIELRLMPERPVE